MTDAAPAPTPRRSVKLAIACAAVILVAVAMWISQLYTTDAARECRALYAVARTGLDSNRVDLTVPASGRRLTEPHSCVNYKRRF